MSAVRIIVALLGSLGGLAMFGFGIWFFVQDLEGHEAVLSHVGLILTAIAIPVYGIGAEMIGEIRGRAANKAIQADASGAAGF